MAETEEVLPGPQHGSQNYFRPNKQIFKKEKLIGPVTAVALLESDDSEILPTSSLSGRGPWIELNVEHVSGRRRTHNFIIWNDHDGGTIHGIKKCCGNVEIEGKRKDVWLIFGARKLSFLLIDKKSDVLLGEYCQFQTIPIQTSKGISEAFLASDWIFDVKAFISRSDESSNPSINAAIGTMNNVVYIMKFDLRRNQKLYLVPQLKRRVVCNVRCITYSLQLFGWATKDGAEKVENLDLAVIVGTVFNEILVWNVLDEKDCIQVFEDNENLIIQKNVIHRLRGHEGVIHSVRMQGNVLVSTSDDRTVRLWCQKNSSNLNSLKVSESLQYVRDLCDGEQSFELQWTGYGHTARIWDSCIVSLSKTIRGVYIETVIASVGEDSTVRIWDLENGNQISVLKGHPCQSIWCVKSFQNGVMITGGNDGTAKLWDIEYHIANNPAYLDSKIDMQALKPSMILNSLQIPQDDKDLLEKVEDDPKVNVEAASDNCCQETGTKKMKKKKPKPKSHQQIVCGIDLFGELKNSKVLVATRAGMLLNIDVNSREITKLRPWSKRIESNEHFLEPSKGACISVRPDRRSVAIATSKGEIVLAPIDESNSHSVFGDPKYPAIQSLHWIDNFNLLSFHIKGTLLWWNVPQNSDPSLRSVLSMFRKGLNLGIPMTFHYDKETKILFTGDSRGNLAVFNCTSGSEEKVQYADDVLSYTHKKEYIMDMVQISNGVLSVGNDGYIHETKLSQDDGVFKLSSVIRKPVPCLTGISRIWLVNKSIVVGGYHGNKYIVWNQSDGYQLLCVDTGGRNRELELLIDFNSTLSPSSHAMVILNTSKNGPNEILFHSNYTEREVYDQICSLSYGVPNHGETVLDIAFCGTSSENKILMVSGSNDCTAKMYSITDGIVAVETELPPHESCIRAVCSSRHNNSKSSILCLAGGKLFVSFYRVDELPTSFSVTFLGTNLLQEYPSIDQRMNAIDALPLNINDMSHFVLSGDSDGGIHLMLVSENIEKAIRFKSHLLAQDKRPILSIALSRVSNHQIIACVGSTGGTVEVWSFDLTDLSNLPTLPVLSYRANQAGVNSISVALLKSSSYKRLIVATGGDDQAISCSVIDLQSTMQLKSVRRFKESCASAIKGIRIGGNSNSGLRLYASGYDQRMSVWSIENIHEETILPSFLSSIPMDIKDINTLDCCTVLDSNGMPQEKVVAAGEGIELASFDPQIWKATAVLKNADYLLITCGAGLSAESGLLTYQEMPEKYQHLCNPLRLIDETENFQTIWSNFARTYSSVEPHEGYKILTKWCGGGKLSLLGDSGVSPWWIYSSNVDGLFGSATCFQNTICEIHGKAKEFRCSSGVGFVEGEKREGSAWQKWHNIVEKSDTTKECSTETFHVEEAVHSIKCKYCNLPARPNVLLFHDTDRNVLDSINIERERYQTWEAKVEKDVIMNGKKLVILEIGAGKNVPAIRSEGLEVLQDVLSGINDNNSTGKVTMIRINPKEAACDVAECSEHTISIFDTAANALRAIDSLLCSE